MKKWEKLDNEISVSKLIMQEKQDRVNDLFFDYILKNHRLVFRTIKETIVNSNEDPALILKRDFLAKYPYYKNLYYHFLKKEGYRHKKDVLECISDLCEGDIENKIEAWKQFNLIQNVEIDKHSHRITITSLNEEYSFFPISSFYKDEVEYIRQKLIRDYPEKDNSHLSSNGYHPYAPENLDYRCYYVATEFVALHPECYAVASICPHCFDGCYWYHCFVIDKEENYAIDISNGFMMPLGDFVSLLEPTILCKVKGKDLSKELENILPEFKKEGIGNKIMFIAFTMVEKNENFTFLPEKK